MLLWRFTTASSGGMKCYLISFHSLKDGAVPAMVATATADLWTAFTARQLISCETEKYLDGCKIEKQKLLLIKALKHTNKYVHISCVSQVYSFCTNAFEWLNSNTFFSFKLEIRRQYFILETQSQKNLK